MSSLSFYFQIKTQITSLFRDHTDLLEEFWEFFKQLYPQVQDEESNQPIKIVVPDNKVEPVKAAFKHKKDRHAQVPQLLLWVTFPIYSMSVEISSHLKLCSP